MIKSNSKASDEDWESIVEAGESTLYFQTREWFDIWAQYAGFESDTRLIRFDSGTKVLLPLAKKKLCKGLISCHFLAPKGMGGFVANDALDRSEKDQLFGVWKEIPMLYCVVNPYDPLTNSIGSFNAQDFTQMLDLREGFESLVRKWSKGHASAVKAAKRIGITIEQAVTREDWKSYYEVYLDTLARWGGRASSRYGWHLFEIMHGMNSDRIKLWLAKYQGRIISGALCLYHNRHVAYWHGATLQEALRMNAPHALQYHIIQNASESGYYYYDMLPSGGHEGVVLFKSGFSPQRKTVNIYMSRLMEISKAIRKRLRNNVAYDFFMKDTGF